MRLPEAMRRRESLLFQRISDSLSDLRTRRDPSSSSLFFSLSSFLSHFPRLWYHILRIAVTGSTTSTGQTEDAVVAVAPINLDRSILIEFRLNFRKHKDGCLSVDRTYGRQDYWLDGWLIDRTIRHYYPCWRRSSYTHCPT